MKMEDFLPSEAVCLSPGSCALNHVEFAKELYTFKKIFFSCRPNHGLRTCLSTAVGGYS